MGATARFDLYTRVSMYFVGLWEPMLVLSATESDPHASKPVLVTASALHAVVCGFLIRDGLRHHLADRPLSTRWLTAGAVSTAALAVAGVVLAPDGNSAVFVGVSVIGAFVTALSVCLPLRTVVASGALLSVGTGAVVLLLGARPDEAMAAALLVVLLLSLTVVTFRVSLWMLVTVRRLDATKRTEARLAVAEERLRFARDLHDVVGRDLSVIAIKSELAAELTRRGHDGALAEVQEIRRLAERSLTEMREVVRGYRETDLRSELAGARAVLSAAGVECEIEGDDGTGLPEPVQAALGWVVREGSTNVLRHSEAKTCTVRLERAAARVTLTMENDGVSTVDGANGSGLAGLAERLMTLGGTVHTERPAPERFRLTARLPLGRSK
ncbi:histidine kinase [Virgisporangium aliadipatigenens]|uniref:Histidine kinase n=1 Tax=Virgisporangium aliadipatigenens TaxID=741659 RepID=A0A8J3YHX5_9ACTN|nr:histidine kinase [Virgisporangium aliadipatigenens]GIJ44258.1 histidine kinase [Virgisporangium aliadipatigenens]